MIKLLFWLAALLICRLKQRPELALENLALRQQLATWKRSQPHPKLRRPDRLFWIGLCQDFAFTGSGSPSESVPVDPPSALRFET